MAEVKEGRRACAGRGEVERCRVRVGDEEGVSAGSDVVLVGKDVVDEVSVKARVGVEIETGTDDKASLSFSLF